MKKIFIMPGEGELVFPGDPQHEFLELTHEMDVTMQRKFLSLMRMIKDGALDSIEMAKKSPAEIRDFIDGLPEAVV